ncbi:MAG: radical SAM protein [Pirellulaceae bacterium]
MTERLDEKPIYHTVAEIRLGTGNDCASVGLKPTGLDACLPDGQILHYDLEGRLTRVATPNVQWRRGLSHRTVRLQKRSRIDGGGLVSTVLEGRDSDGVVGKAAQQIGEWCAALHGGRYSLLRSGPREDGTLPTLGEMMSRAAAFDIPAAHADLDQFRKLYGDVPILPPDQYGSLVLLATDGCVYNQCTFCGFYRGDKYRMRNEGQFREHVRNAVSYHGGGLAARRGIFLGQANAIVGPKEWRETTLATIHDLFEFPPTEDRATRSRWWQGSRDRFQDISSFLDVFTGARIPAEEFAAMRRFHIRRLYLGIETGDHELLSWLNKPATSREMLATVGNIKKAGLSVGIIILVGAGGERFFHSHIDQTVQLLRAMRLGRGDFIYLSPLVEMPETEYAHQALAGHIEPLSPSRLTEQEQRIRAGLNSGPREERPYVARYNVSRFVY